MADSLYTALSPKKKRRASTPEDDSVSTPKRLRIASLLSSRKHEKSSEIKLPHHLSRLQTIFSGLQHALSHALASCTISPASDTGIIRNVLTHLSLSNYTGLAIQVSIDDIRRLCWLWEWDGKTKPSQNPFLDPDENPFLESPSDSISPFTSKEWTRGSMGIILTPATHFSKTEGKRVPAYGIGVEVDLNKKKDKSEGMAAVAKWTSATGVRLDEFTQKLDSWFEIHGAKSTIPDVPKANLPSLPSPENRPSALTRALLASSSSPSKSLFNSPTKSRSSSPTKIGFTVPFPMKSPSKNVATIPFPETPRRNRVDSGSSLLTPRTPRTSLISSETPGAIPSTPVHQRGQDSATAPETPSTSRRQALYERVRQKSLNSSPVKGMSPGKQPTSLTRDQMLKLNQDELRRRCLLGRLSGVAESVWMLFTGPVSSSSTASTTRKRRALPAVEVANSVIKSSPIPISLAETRESLNMLIKLCPFFLRGMTIGSEEWLEMPAQCANASESSPVKKLPGNIEGRDK